MTINAISPNYNFNLMQEIPTTSQNLPQNLAKDKSQAVKEVLSYGVDSEGFFTSDLNEAAGIPKDIKVDAGLGIKYYLSSLPILGYYNNINLVGSVKNFYQSFSKLSEQEKENIVNQAKDIKYSLDNGKVESLYDVLLEKFADSKGELNQSGKLEAFIRMNPNLMVAEKTINLAIQGNGAYANFIDKNDNLLGMNILDKGKAGQLLRTSINEMSAEEFGKQWGELRKEYQAKYDKRQEQFRKENEEIEEYNKNLAEQKTKNKFKPIQVTKKSETYQDSDFLNMLDFIQSQQKLEQILLLFNQESNNEALNLKRFERFFKMDLGKLNIEV